MHQRATGTPPQHHSVRRFERHLVDGNKVADEQRTGGGGLDRSDRQHQYYLKTDVPIRSLKVHLRTKPEEITRESFINLFFPNFNPDDEEEVADAAEDLAKIDHLIHRYLTGQAVHPLVVDKDNYLRDGFHRLAALNTLGRLTADLYVQVPLKGPIITAKPLKGRGDKIIGHQKEVRSCKRRNWRKPRTAEGIVGALRLRAQWPYP